MERTKEGIIEPPHRGRGNKATRAGAMEREDRFSWGTFYNK
ncbi:MAG: hypothetical protein SOU14_04355 [Succiniclasticum sp.]|nr:hypothetical protein [Succiniclasticum sp.]